MAQMSSIQYNPPEQMPTGHSSSNIPTIFCEKLSEVRSWRIIKSNFFDIWQNKNFADFGHADLEKRIRFGQNFWT